MAARRRGAHAAARPSALSFVSARRAPQSAAGGRARVGGGTGGKRVTSGGTEGRKPGGPGRTPLLRVVMAVAAVGIGAMGFYGGLLSSSSAEPTVQAFLLDWQQRDYQAAARLTTGDPATVARELRNAYLQLHAAAVYLSMGPIVQHPGIARASFHASVDLGQDGAPWNYEGRFTLRKFGQSWKILWSPAVINPGLRPGQRLAVVTSLPRRAQLLDASGKPLQVPSPVYEAGVRPASLASPRATATALSRATGLDTGQVLGQIMAAPRSGFFQLLTLSPAAYARLRPALARVPGLVIRSERIRLFRSIASDVVGSVDTEISPVLRREGISYYPGSTIGLSGLQHVYQSRLAGTPTTEVVAEGPGGDRVRVLKRWTGHPAAPVRTTLDAGVQQAADSAAAAAGSSAALVAVQASTGRILAVAGHQAPGSPSLDPLAGRYPPGNAFTIVSAEALLATGLPVTTTIRCTSTSNVGGHVFVNQPPVHLGAQPTFAADFTHGCGTAFAGLSLRFRLHPDLLTAAASGFGVGAHWELPLPAFAGSMPSGGSVAALAASTVGQGQVRVSPLGMAMVAAHVASGSWHPPSLVSAGAHTQAASRAVFPAARIQALRSLMRATVRNGAARPANLAGQPVYGQVGVTPTGDHQWASWFVGYRGDLAFALLLVSKSPLTSAAPAAAQFLNSVPAR
jgi:cell division protein FtsI/penicillin-binding protein 2